LDNELQITLKVCAVIGLQVTIKLLKAIHPSSQNEKFLRRSLMQLAEAGIMIAERDPDHNLYSFKHGYFQEAAYSLLSLDSRKELHEMIANEYEVTLNEKELEPFYGVLGKLLTSHSIDIQLIDAYYCDIAHHWSKAEHWEKTLFYKTRAGHVILPILLRLVYSATRVTQ
jgi:hypothetical protein